MIRELWPMARDMRYTTVAYESKYFGRRLEKSLNKI